MNNNNMNGNNNAYQRISPGMYRAPNGRQVTQQQMQRTMQRHPGQFQQAPQQQMQQPQQQQFQPRQPMQPMNGQFIGGINEMMQSRAQGPQGIDPGFNMDGMHQQPLTYDRNNISREDFQNRFGNMGWGGGGSGQFGRPGGQTSIGELPGAGQAAGRAFGQAMGPAMEQNYQQAQPNQMQFRPGTSGHEMMLARNAKTNQQRAKFGVVNQQPQGILSMPPKMAGGY